MSDALRVTVFDYGAGNLHSLVKALEAPDTIVQVETDPKRAVQGADAFILPGVGAFAPAAERLKSGLAEIREALRRGLPCLGICLGMQLLYEGSSEGEGDGIAMLAGRVTKLNARCVPQIGWNSLQLGERADSLFAESGLNMAWFANSFVARPTKDTESSVIAWSEHERDRFPSAVRSGHVVGAQFHPEKSSTAGVQFVRAFLNEARAVRFSLQPSGR
ncbi:MAG: imidazole glycerol phosphate synthase subunit HisH [Gemmatimonadaceae bacterium]